MCIVCHYRSDNILVTRERRQREHKDGSASCIHKENGKLWCIDCEEFVESNHVCEYFQVLQQYNRRKLTGNVYKKPCPTCGAKPGERCSTKEDHYPKSHPCRARKV